MVLGDQVNRVCENSSMRDHGHKLTKRILKEGPQQLDTAICVGCREKRPTQFTKMGSVLSGETFKSLKDIEIINGHLVDTVQKVSYLTRKRGPICTICASDYRSVLDYQGNIHYLVKVD